LVENVTQIVKYSPTLWKYFLLLSSNGHGQWSMVITSATQVRIWKLTWHHVQEEITFHRLIIL